MQVGIVSDTHDRTDRVQACTAILRERNIDLVLHCGDIESAETVELFAGLRTHFVLGNCDRDAAGLGRAIERIGGTLHEHWGQIELAGRQIAWIHGHDRPLFKELEAGDCFDFLFYGHSHAAETHRTGRTLVVNPGALFRTATPSFAILDLESGAVESVLLG